MAEILARQSGLLSFAELLIATATALTTAACTKAASWAGLCGVVPATFGDDARAAAYQPLHFATASRARLDLRVGHLLPLLESASAGIALIFVRWHRKSSFNLGSSCRYYTNGGQSGTTSQFKLGWDRLAGLSS
jgi:hypothetical protein